MEPLQLLAIVNEPAACKEGDFCRESPSNSHRPKCNSCRLSPANERGVLAGVFPSEWKPVSHRHKHPVLEKEKRDAKRQKALARQAVRKAKDPAKQARAREAERAERRTNAKIISATRNSGRINRDGDHLYHSDIVLDTKQQSTAKDPIIHLHELDKVRNDAVRNGRRCGCLVLRNKYGRGVVVIDERDLPKLIGG